MESLELVYDHYKDTYENIKSKESSRGKYFLACVGLLSLLLIVCIEPSSQQMLISFIQKQVESDVLVSFSAIQTGLWLTFLYMLVRYYQTDIHINRLYQYLHCIEEHVATKIDFDFCREGKHYLNKYPALSRMIYYAYKLVFPLIFNGIIMYKIFNQIISKSNYIPDIFIASVCVFIIGTYVGYSSIEIFKPKRKKDIRSGIDNTG